MYVCVFMRWLGIFILHTEVVYNFAASYTIHTDEEFLHFSYILSFILNK